MSVMVTDRSACGVSVSVSVAAIGEPPGGVAVTVLVSEPVALGLIVAVKLKVTLALTGRFTVVAKAPLPLAGPETLPPPVLPVAVQVPAVTPAGSGSETAAPVTAFGPVLLTTIVYVSLLPGTTLVLPSSIATTRGGGAVTLKVTDVQL